MLRINNEPKGGTGYSIKWQILGYFAVFCIVMLLILWLFQVVLLDDFYKGIKTHSAKLAGDVIAREVESENATPESIREAITEESRNHDICVMVIGSNGSIVKTVEHSRNCIIHNASYMDLIALADSSAAKGDSVLYNFYYDAQKGMMIGKNVDGISGFKDNPTKDEYWQNQGENGECIIYVKMAGDELHPTVIMINSAVTPVISTVQTLRYLLVLIMMIMLIFASCLAYVISRAISNPIIKISNASKELARGNYEINFSNKGFREVRELGESLNYAASELGKTEKFQREIIANVSHDLRTPLTMITGYAEVMRDLPGENTPENLQVIIDESNRLTTLVNDALDLSKLQSGYQAPNMEKYHFTKSVEDILQRFAKLKAEEGYDIIFDHDEDVWICGDEVKISQAVYNLIINAITHAGEDKQVIVRQRVVRRVQNRKSKDRMEELFVRIEVIDHGEGIEKDKLKDIWQRYYKVDKTHKRAHMGTGLGLSIVRNVLDMHEARYGVESKVGQGSTFWFEIALSSDWHKATERSIDLN